MAYWIKAVVTSRCLETPSFLAWLCDLVRAAGSPRLSWGALAAAEGD